MFLFFFKIIQFPIRPAFVITIKSQGQMLDMIGIWLKEPVFTHGQIYVALSRVSNFDLIKNSLFRKRYSP